MALIVGGRYGQTGPPRGEDYGARPGASPGSSTSRSSTATSTGGRGGPLGVPRGYVATPTRYDARYAGRHPSFLQYMPLRPGAASEPVDQPPRYMDGDEWKPASRRAEEIVEMQQKLVIAGYLNQAEGFRLGMWDGPTRTAYKYLLEDANAAGINADMMLYRAAQSVEVGGQGDPGGGGGGMMIDPVTGELIPVPGEQFVKPAFHVRTTHPDDLRKVFRSAVIDKLGQGWSQEQIDELVEAYNWKEMQIQADFYRQEVARQEQEFMFEQGLGPEPTQDVISEVSIPSAENFIDEEARRRDPSGYAATEIAEDFAPAFFAALGSPGSQFR